jgi:hypothetical protein
MIGPRITNYFSKCSVGTYVAQGAVEIAKVQLSLEEKKAREKEFLKEMESNCRKRIHDAVSNVIETVELSAVDAVRNEINDLTNPDFEDLDMRCVGAAGTIKTSRPQNWRVIAEMFTLGASVESLKRQYPEIGIDKKGREVSDMCMYMRMRRWKEDFEKELRGGAKIDKVSHPAYGEKIDKLLVEKMKERISAGVSVDSFIAREHLLVLLKDHNKTALLRENGGSNTFGVAWAHRFFKRNHLPVRVVTTKMREKPDDFNEKVQTFLDILALTLSTHSVPPSLVVNMDETGVHFISNATRTRAVKGSKRIRLQGVGKDKAQFTATLAVTEDGSVLGCQFIFAGKTVRCHPKVAPPKGCFYSHTKSHWQEENSLLEWIHKIAIPYRKSVLDRDGLRSDQKMILILDLHYTHKTEAALKTMSENNILPVFIPGGCTDEIQTLDVCVNKAFKTAVKGAFRDHTHALFNEYIAGGKDPERFQIPLTMTAVKPYVVEFVKKGLDAISSTEFQESISKCFKKEGLLERARTMTSSITVDAVIVPDEVEYDDLDDIIDELVNDIVDSDNQ